jgi:hypothetical protein
LFVCAQLRRRPDISLFALTRQYAFLLSNYQTVAREGAMRTITTNGDRRRLMIATLRYLDTFAKVDGAWLFAERRLYVDWLEERTLS